MVRVAETIHGLLTDQLRRENVVGDVNVFLRYSPWTDEAFASPGAFSQESGVESRE